MGVEDHPSRLVHLSSAHSGADAGTANVVHVHPLVEFIGGRMLEDQLAATLLAVGAHLTREGGRLMGPLGLTQQESAILIQVSEQDGMSQRALRSRLLLERSNVSKAVARLGTVGLVQAQPDPADRRSVIVRATPRGRETANECLQLYREWNLAWMRGVDRDRIADTVRFLDDIRRGMPDSELGEGA